MCTPAHFGEFATLLREIIRSSCSHPALPCSEQAFDRLAVSLFGLQFDQNPSYRLLCESRNLSPPRVAHWTQIPSVPALAFKEMDLSCLPPQERTAVFHSSGTTGQRPSRHFHGDVSLELYEASLWPWFSTHLLPELSAAAPPNAQIPRRLVMLSPPPEVVPHSSLARMFATIQRQGNWNESGFFGQLDVSGNWTLDTAAAVACLKQAAEFRQATLILGTAFSLVHLLDHLHESGLAFQLPAGSRVMETGGYKGRSRALARPELHALISRYLGIPAGRIVCEYGMSELSSQAYDRAVSNTAVNRRFGFPPWARVQIISAETGQEVGEGQTGLIRVFDLANVYSVLAIQTEDLGIRRGEGFELLGRAQTAEPRGCSLAAA